MAMQPEQNDMGEMEPCQPSIGKDEHDAMRTGPVEVGGKEKSTKELMKPGTGDNLDG